MKTKEQKDFNRELEGPDSYEYFNNISTKCQKYYINLLRYQLIIFLIIAIISTFPIGGEAIENFKNFTNIILMITVLILMIVQFSKNYMAGWQKARFMAESILSNCWLFIFKCENYNLESYEEALIKFRERIKEMKEEVNIKDYLSISTRINIDHDNPQWMKDKFSDEVMNKKSFYLKYRIEDQIHWYSIKTDYNNNKSTNYFIYGLISMGLGIAFTILIIMKHIPNISYLGLFTTLSASLFSWKQTKRFDELKTTYSVTVDELQDFRNLLEMKNTESDVKELIMETEKSISREHKLWFSNNLT